MQFPPSVWGPFFCHTIHIVALGYPKSPTYTDKKSAKEFYESFAFLLPCAICREHYKDHLGKNPLTPFLDSKKDLLKWTIDIHNAINKMLMKPETAPLPKKPVAAATAVPNTATAGNLPFELKNKSGVMAFQDWLDRNVKGWAKGYKNNMINKGINENSCVLGSYYVLSALTMVSNEAATSLPWLYEAVNLNY